MNKLSFYFLSLVVLLSFMGCKKTSDPDPAPVQVVTIKYPFKVQLAYPLADTTNPVLEVSPNGLVKLIFRLSADERITVIDFLTKDQEKGEQSLKGYPYVVESYDPTPPSNAQIQYIGSNNFYLTQMIRIPNYVKDSVVITVKIVKYDLSSKSMKLVLKVKKQVNFQISGVSLNAISFTGNPLTMYAGDLIRSFGGSVNTAGELTKLTAALWVDNEKTATTSLPFGKNSYDEYEDVYSGYESNITSHKFYYTLSVTSSMLPIRQEFAGKNTRVRFTAMNDLGDSASLEVPILIGTRNILQAGPFNLGAVRSPD
jgi:predicted component of type VI protein secretion system